ncbi:MAG: SDR family oxidoreductase [Planctomycetes bacterium]|nr:SDR family oxidoreductase [Planctomycetota bacterium]
MILQGKTVVVTGAGGGIGRAICLRLADDGARVVVTDLKQENAEKVASDIRAQGGTAFAYKADVTDSAEVRDVAKQILSDLRQVDILVNNAGGSAALLGKLSEFKDAPEEVWSWVINLNLMGTMRFTQALLHHMLERRSGKIINIASIAAEVGIINRVDYSAAKGGVVAMTKALAMEVGPCGVTVNSISPGLISRSTDPAGTETSEGTYLKRSGSQNEVASLVSFLASSEADFITGVNYTIDGGRTLGPTGKGKA